jgi:hypothetical protein
VKVVRRRLYDEASVKIYLEALRDPHPFEGSAGLTETEKAKGRRGDAAR